MVSLPIPDDLLRCYAYGCDKKQCARHATIAHDEPVRDGYAVVRVYQARLCEDEKRYFIGEIK